MKKETTELLSFLYSEETPIYFSDIKRELSISDRLTIFRIITEAINKDLIEPQSFLAIREKEDPINLTAKGKYLIETIKEKKKAKKGLGSLLETDYIPESKREGRGLGHFVADNKLAPEARKGTGLGWFVEDKIGSSKKKK